MQQEQTKSKNVQPQWNEDFETLSNDAVSRAKELIQEGNVRRLVIRKADEEVLLDVPLMPAVVVGGLMTFWMPFLTVLSVVAAFVAKLKVNVVHIEAVDENTDSVEITS